MSLPVVLTLALLTFLIPAHTYSQVLVRIPGNTTNNLRAIDFFDDSAGLIVGDVGTILVTADGGSTWSTAASNTTAHLLCVGWLSSKTAIAGGYSGVILRTSDAGGSWAQVASGVTLPFAGFDAWDSLNAIIGGYNGAILRTTDGGVSWLNTSQQNGPNHIGVAYADSLTVCLSGNFGKMFRSTDGGDSWSVQTFGNSTFNDVVFLDSVHGVSVGSGANLCLRSTDGGENWTGTFLPGTFDDLARGPDGRLVAAGIGVASSDDGGAHWTFRALPARLRAIAAFDSGRYIAAGDNGIILRTAADPIDPPPPEPGSPADGETSAPLSAEWRQEFSLRLTWKEYTAFFPEIVRIQMGLDSAFSGTPILDSTSVITGFLDTARTVRRLLPGRRYFWRVRLGFNGIMSPWSATRSFIPEMGHTVFTVRGIQTVPADSLLLADSLTAIARDRWTLQASPLHDSTGFLVVRCASDPADLYDPSYIYQGASAGMFFYGVDTGAGGPGWRGMKITPGWFSGRPDLIEEFARVRRGDLLVCAGHVSEDPWSMMGSETSFYVDWLFVLDSAGAVPAPTPAAVGDFYFRPGPNLLERYSTGEQWEGGYVRLTDLTVHSTGSGPVGTFVVTTRDGLRIATADYSRWFTLRSHRDPASAYQPPFIGRHIDTLGGYITTMSGDIRSYNLPAYRISPVTRGDIVYGTPTGNLFRGQVFYDSSRNGVQDGNEPGITGWKVILGGLVSGTLTTLPDGGFSADGIDSGTYRATLNVPEGWFTSTTGATEMEFTLGLGDTLELPPFGIYYGWNSASGTVFEDLNENGLRDPGDPGLPGVLVRLAAAAPDSTVTDFDGNFSFTRIRKELATVSIKLPPLWEQIAPMGNGSHTLEYQEYDSHIGRRDFSLRRAPYRVKVRLTVRDFADEAIRDIFFGARPGASYGVWGADTAATLIDFSEEEFEIPPRTYGLFDARFIDPRGGFASFGEGTWTDIRGYISPDQVDSFRIEFQPGVLFGGRYPMRLFWSGAKIESSYSGAVTMGDTGWNPLLDMKAADSLIITDTTVGSVTILASGPVLRITGVPEIPVVIPSEFSLGQNYPNPFNPETWIPYDVPAAGRVSLRVYDILGKEVAELVDGVQALGKHVERWAPGPLPSGVYFCRMRAGRYSAVRKMLFLR